jgi:hypothetical protein
MRMYLPTVKELRERGQKDGDEAHTVEEWHLLLRFLRLAAGLEEYLVRGSRQRLPLVNDRLVCKMWLAVIVVGATSPIRR